MLWDVVGAISHRLSTKFRCVCPQHMVELKCGVFNNSQGQGSPKKWDKSCAYDGFRYKLLGVCTEKREE